MSTSSYDKLECNTSDGVSPDQIPQSTREYGESYDKASPQKQSQMVQFSWPAMSEKECTFRVQISGVQCRNLEKRKFLGKSDPFVEFFWSPKELVASTGEKNVPFITSVIKGDLNPTWKGLIFAFDYKSTVKALQNKFLTVKVFSSRTFKDKTLIGETKIDLHTIATGAVHHDHHLGGSMGGRVVFNCAMEQCSEWEVQIQNIGLALPAIIVEADRSDGHDYREDRSLPLHKYAVSYKCTIRSSETFYMGTGLKIADERTLKNHELSYSAQARLKILSRRIHDHNHNHNPTVCKGTPATGNAEEVNNNDLKPVGANWKRTEDFLPSIVRYSTFDELMSGTLKLEIRGNMTGRGQITSTDSRFVQSLNDYIADLKEEGGIKVVLPPGREVYDDDIWNTFLFGQSWISLEKLFEDAMSAPHNTIEVDGQGTAQLSSMSCTFQEKLALAGHMRGYVFGTVVFTKLPNVRQKRSGVISENGTSASSSVIVGMGKLSEKGKTNLPIEAQRVLEKMEDLMSLMNESHRDEEEPKIRKASKILIVLQTSHKGSMLSWVYSSTEALDETKAILIRLWVFLLEKIRVREYTLRNIFYEILFYLLKRAELSDLPLLGFDSITSSVLGSTVPIPPTKEAVAFALLLRSMMLETKCCVLYALSNRGVLNKNFMFYVARMLSILCFRLPSFGVELYALWAESYSDTVEELAGEFEFSSTEAHGGQKLDWRPFHKAIFKQYGGNVMKAQEEEAEEKYEVIVGSCKQRLLRLKGEANTLNILVVDQWMWYVLDTLAVLNQKIGWAHLPGYTQILKVYFLELRLQQRTGPLSPAMYKLSCTMLSNTALINPMTKFLVARTSAHNVSASISAVELLGVWMYMIRSWRVRLGHYRLSHLENNDRWNFAQDAQYSIPLGDTHALLPATYDYRFLCSALRILLESEQTQIVLTTLEFMFNSWDCFPERHADKLRFEMLQVFFKLFLHWNKDVRLFFQTLVSFRALKPHGWTLVGNFVSTPPQSRRHIDAVAVDFNSALGNEEQDDRVRSYSTAGGLFGMFSAASSGSSTSPRTSLTSPRNGSPSPRSSPTLKAMTSPKIMAHIERKFSADFGEASLMLSRSERRSRTGSIDIQRRDGVQIANQPMDPGLHITFLGYLETIYVATQSYIKRREERAKSLSISQGVSPDKASWKKKGCCLKQGFIYKNLWSKRYFSLQNDKLGYSHSESGPIKRQISICGAKISELPNQIGNNNGRRTVLNNCFMIENGFQSFTLSAPNYEEMRDWMEVLNQNATDDTTTSENEKLEELPLADLQIELSGIAGKNAPLGVIDEVSMAYTVASTKEWLQLRTQTINAQTALATNERPDIPILLSKSSSYIYHD